MFDVDSSELIVVLLIALLVIGPKDMPRVLRTVGRWVAKARALSGQVRSGFDDIVRQAELEELEKKWADENAKIMAAHPVSVDDPPVAPGTEAPQMEPLPPPSADGPLQATK